MIGFARTIAAKVTARLYWRRGDADAVNRSLAHDLGVPPDVVRRVLEQTAADLRQLAKIDDSSDARPIISKAFDELSKHARQADLRDSLIVRFLDELPERDYTILAYAKQGKKHREIAEIMGTDMDSVRGSLVKTYADLRLKLGGFGGGGDGEDQTDVDALSEQSRASSINQGLHQAAVVVVEPDSKEISAGPAPPDGTAAKKIS